jgi:drug/metabolite transporter (DMT)-like permease
MHDAAVKWLIVDIPVWQILFFRSATILTICLSIGRGRLLRRAAASPLKRPLAYRGVVMLTAWLCYYSAARTLPLAQLLCLYFAAPLMITIMASRILKEHVTGARWAAVIIGFAGVLCATDPFGVRASFATLLVLIAAALWGYGIILMRQIAQREPTLVQMLGTNTVFLLATGAVCLIRWQPLSWMHCGELIGVGVIGGLAQFLVFEAARMIPASVMATVEYTALPWAFLLGYWIWLDIPALAVFFGAALIILAGAILVRAERRAA